MLILAQRNQTSSTLSSTLTPCESWVEVRRWPPNPRFGEFSTLSSVRELFNVFLLNRRQFNSRDRTQFVKSGLRPSGSWIRKIGAWQIITKFYVFCKFQCSITMRNALCWKIVDIFLDERENSFRNWEGKLEKAPLITHVASLCL